MLEMQKGTPELIVYPVSMSNTVELCKSTRLTFYKVTELYPLVVILTFYIE